MLRLDIIHSIDNPDNIDLFWSMSKIAPVSFSIRGIRNTEQVIKVTITQMELEDGSCHAWNLQGRLVSGVLPVSWSLSSGKDLLVRGWYHNRSKDLIKGSTHGFLEKL